ncbi:beta strand repeat-containing protein [Tuwongella immobilis]|uniref:Bacterial Ig-like domain-containing protein n=1 Tax=Tuwongella immobilis TaxID=692036 RepID=A0A6C2YJE9_9BACT|nr:Ig-like domain repeat protein [Tuwongella immobilis]VIP01369.1 Hemolysin-type calcium-binding region domain protein OS=Rhodopirellula maiorica SM1 GN=RMSM_03614 PE=4 SV=1: Autotrns_rpt: Autotrns_rpt [Tuwongella immobilis]VTR98200.1 Hemolysin-type calcium-binding region domain protein OS=Rhodopirellula maiorica SM1 GN=RMSM_03614 PE=4 SV=1: Autotrns_rpt: Autotrns_rpt [Tuwongella immobilis]
MGWLSRRNRKSAPSPVTASPARPIRPMLESLDERVVPATHTWTGGGGNSLWSNAANWNGGVPVNDPGNPVTVVFNTAANVTVDSLTANLKVNEIRFDPGSTTILTLNTQLTVDSGAGVPGIEAFTTGNKITGASKLNFTGFGHQIIAPTNTTLTISAPITGSGQIEIRGAGDVWFQGANSYTGTTFVSDGHLSLYGGVGNLANLQVGDGDNGTASGFVTVTVNASVSATNALVRNDGTIGLAGNSTFTANTLTLGNGIGGGTVQGAGTLVVNNAINVTPSPTSSKISSELAFGNLLFTVVTVDNGTAATDLLVTGEISGSKSFRKTGAGTMRLESPTGNSFTGQTSVRNGVLELATPSGLNAVNNLVSISGDLDTNPTLRLINSNVIADGKVLNLGFLGTLDINGKTETIGQLNITNDGKALVNNGQLTISTLTMGTGSINNGATGTLILDGNTTINADGTSVTSSILNGTINLAGGTRLVTVNGTNPLTRLNVTSKLSNGKWQKEGTGTLALNTAFDTSAILDLRNGTVVTLGDKPNLTILQSGGTLQGSGLHNTTKSSGGVIQPTIPLAPLGFENLTTSGATTFAMTIFQMGQSSQVRVVGAATLNNAALALTENFPILPGSSFTLLVNDDVDPVEGTFAGLPEGAIVTAGNASYRISYVGGDGNDITVVKLKDSTTLLTLSVPSAPLGTNVTLKATVAAQGEIPTGTVSFFQNEVLIGSAAVNAEGVATLVVSATPQGEQIYGATYDGSATLAPSSSQKTPLEVTAAIPPVPPVPNFPPPPPNLPPAPPPAEIDTTNFAVGADAGGGIVRYFNADQTERYSLVPFDGFFGGIRTAVGDFNGDGTEDLVVGTGPGIFSVVRILDGVSQAELFAINPFPDYTLGVYVSAGDMNGDGIAELMITPDQGGGPRVRIFRGGDFVQVADFFGINDPNFRGGARAALSDINADGVGDIVVSAGFGGGPRITIWDGLKVLENDLANAELSNFFAFESSLRNGAFVTAGDINGDGYGDLVFGGGPGGGPRVRIFDGKQLLAAGKIGDVEELPESAQLANFFAGDVNNRGGVRLTLKKLDADDKADLVVGAGEGAGSAVTGYLADQLLADQPLSEFSFEAFPGFVGGVFVG